MDYITGSANEILIQEQKLELVRKQGKKERKKRGLQLCVERLVICIQSYSSTLRDNVFLKAGIERRNQKHRPV
jgi:hypothetical protein